MRPLELAERFLQPFRVRGAEIIPDYCPFCHGGKNGDKWTFALNMLNETFNCKRGSCGRTGTFKELCEHFGVTPTSPQQYFDRVATQKRQYKTPRTKIQPAGPEVEAYLRSRGFSKETWERRGVGEHQGNIAFPYYENGKLVLVKFRPPRKVRNGERKSWREEGGKPVFWGMDLCDPNLPLVICEGEMDALALDEAGVPNVVSVPSGAEDLTCVDLCWDWLQQFERVIIWPDNDEPGQGMCRKLITKLGEWRCSVVKSPYKDANEHLFYEGKESVMRAVVNAEPVPIVGLISLADAKPFDVESAERVKSSIKAVNELIGGYMMGQLTVWTGINGSGKSTFLGQELLWAIDQGYNVCAYSGELPAALFRYWIDIQAAGPRFLVEREDKLTGKTVKRPDPYVVQTIQEWYRDKFFLVDALAGFGVEDILRVFNYAAMRYNCQVFLVDNLMMVVSAENERDYYIKQSEIVGRFKEFATKHNVHVHLVAHPRKTEGRVTKMDIAGSSNITNRADNVLSIHRVHPMHREEYGCDTIIDLLKSRFTGFQDDEIRLQFDYDSKRFYMQSNPDVYEHNFGWIELLKVGRATA